MAILRTEDIREMSEKELKEKMRDMKTEIMEERGQIETGGFADNPGRIGEMKKTIARIKTVLNERRNN